MNKWSFRIIVLFCFASSCSTYPESPEEVIREFIDAWSSGDCDKAMSFCSGEARISVQASIDMGCESYQTVIDSVNCNDKEDFKQCTCYETRTKPKSIPSEFKLELPYKMELIEGKWKIISLEKDHPECENLEHEHDSTIEIDNESTEKEIKWVSKNFYPQWIFTDSFSVVMEFYGQCIYEFPTNIGDDKDWVSFDLNMDCTSNMYLSETFGLSEHPEIGDQFIKYHAAYDTLYLEYIFQDWTDSVNSKFPENPVFMDKLIRKEF